MREVIVYKAYGRRGGLEWANPGLEWAGLVLATFDVLRMPFVLRNVIRNAKLSTDLGAGLGPEWGRNGLEWVVFSLRFITNEQIQGWNGPAFC